MTEASKAKGRPGKFTQNLASKICERIADGESLRDICSCDDMPSKSTVLKWASGDSDFADQYARARSFQADLIFDEILEIADDARNDFMKRENEQGVKFVVVDHENIQRSKLRIDARKWMAGKLRPKKYGDRMTHEGDETTPIILKFSKEDTAL